MSLFERLGHRLAFRIGVSVGGFVLVVLILALLGLAGGAFGVSGMEFSPYSFERRSFLFSEAFGRQVTANKQETHTGDLEKYLQTQNLIRTNPAVDEQERWDLVRSQGIDVRPGDWDASILCEILDMRTGSGFVWENWSAEHPKLAKELWPRVQQLAKDQLYIYTPQLFDEARSASDPQDLAARLDERMAESYLAVALSLSQQGKYAMAVDFATRGLACDSDNIQVLQARAEAYRSLGESQKSLADTQRVSELQRRSPQSKPMPERLDET